MTISYPLSLPVATKVIQSIELRAINAVAYSRSPFTFSGQAFAYPGQMWTADVTLKPMKRADAEQWVAWLISLRGQLGTFLLGDPTGVTPRGSALGGRVNLRTYSEQFDNAAAWAKNGTPTVSANAGIAPDGLTTADQLSTNASSFGVYGGSSISSIQVVTLSIYVKNVSSATAIQIGDDAANAVVIVNSVTGAITSAGPGVTSSSISSAGNGWYRVSVTYTPATTYFPQVIYSASSSTMSWLVWGAQVELGSTATTYQPIFNSYGPYVNGASQTGGSLVIDGASPDETGYLLAGDYIQLGTNGSSRLHKVLTNVNTDSSGNATLDIWPHIRVAPADNATVTVSSAKGLFRLSSNEQAWSVNEAAIYGITFSAMEAV